MTKTMTIRRIGGSLGGTFPSEIMDRLNVEEGDTLYLIEREDGILITPHVPKIESVMEAYEHLGKRYRNTLEDLAK
ncbi:MAG TPA: AbrB/MazE/SpoVT family DNA-binding domain-containing protein [Longimicrobium sp.]|nr:AbrB/MazE/SpoVT family DNA-binding domain-containing protein [Longimicrobium sp.]